MTKIDLWITFVKRNPSFEGDGNITLSKAGLRKLFETTWEVAEERGIENGKAAEKLNFGKKMDAAYKPKDASDAFNEMFGGKGSPFAK